MLPTSSAKPSKVGAVMSTPVSLPSTATKKTAITQDDFYDASYGVAYGLDVVDDDHDERDEPMRFSAPQTVGSIAMAPLLKKEHSSVSSDPVPPMRSPRNYLAPSPPPRRGVDSSSSSDDDAVAAKKIQWSDKQMVEMLRQLAVGVGPQKFFDALRASTDPGLAESRVALERLRFELTNNLGGAHHARHGHDSAVVPNDEDWQARMESVVCLREGHRDEEASRELHEITQEFMQTAKMYGRVIISERDLPLYEKSIKPAKLGGVAGGEKYVIGGILFKFSLDVELFPGAWMYGGTKRDDEAAHKAAGHERKGIETLLKKLPPCVLSVPLMTLVDYRGCRLSAQSLLPLKELLYGSADGAKTIRVAETEAYTLSLIEKLGSDLGLARHRVTETSTGQVKSICFPVDIEIHRSAANSRVAYIIDTARLMPPQRPTSAHKREIFYKLFRPEFVASYGTPLSPDAFSAFGLLDREVHNANIVKATAHLHDKVIPEVAASMTADDAKHVTRVLQQRGVNARFLGLVRKHCVEPKVREALEVEMIARVVQKRLRAQWRENARFNVLPLVHSAVDTLNGLITGQAKDWIKVAIAAKYGEVALEQFDHLPDLIRSSAVLLRTSKVSGVAISHVLIGTGELLSVSDVVLEAQVKELGFSVVAQAESLCQEAKLKAKSGSVARAVALLEQALRILKRELIGDPKNAELRCRVLRILLKIVRLQANDNVFDDTRFELACRAFEEEIRFVALEGPEVVSDAQLFEAKLRIHTCLRDAKKLRAPEALRSWKECFTMLQRVSHKENWLLQTESSRALEQIERARARHKAALRNIIFSVSNFGQVSRVVSDLTVEDLRYADIFSQLEHLDRKDAMARRLVAILLKMGDTSNELRQWFSRQTVLKPAKLTLDPVDDDFMTSFAQIAVPALTRVTDLRFDNVVCSWASLEPLLRAVEPWCETLVFVDCATKLCDPLFNLLSSGWPRLRKFVLTDSAYRGNGLWNKLPKSLEYLNLSGNPFLTVPAETAVLPPCLRTLRLLRCSKISSGALAERLVGSVSEALILDDLREEDAKFLRPSLRKLRLDNGTVLGTELPDLPELRKFKPGRHITGEGFVRVCRTSPLLESIVLRNVLKLGDEVVREAFSVLPNLKHIHIGNSVMTDAGVVQGLVRSGAKLTSFNSVGAWGVTSAGLVPVVDWDRVRAIKFNSPRPPMFELLGRASNTLVSLSFSIATTWTDQTWDFLCRCTASLRKLRLTEVVSCNDANLERLLRTCKNLRELKLINCPAEGPGFAAAAASGALKNLKSLKLKATLLNEDALAESFQYLPDLKRIIFDGSGEGEKSMLALARSARKIEFMVMTSPSKTSTFRDKYSATPNMGTLKTLMVYFTVAYGQSVMINGRNAFGQLKALTFDGLYRFDDSMVETLLSMKSMRYLVLERSYITRDNFFQLMAAKPPLHAFIIQIFEGNQYSEQLYHRATGLSDLAYLAFIDFPGGYTPASDISMPVWYEQIYLPFGRIRRYLLSALVGEDDFIIDGPDEIARERMLSFRAILPSVSVRNKWAFFVWGHDGYALRFVLQFAGAGCKVIVAMAKELPDGTPNEMRMTRLVLELLGPEQGIYFLYYSIYDPLEVMFAPKVKALTTQLDFVYCFVPQTLANVGMVTPPGSMFKPQDSTVKPMFDAFLQRGCFSQV